MKFYETLLISIGLGMDAMAVSICKGLAMKKMDWKKATIIGLYFGIFQMIMPIIGYILGSKFEKIIESMDHWIAFGLLLIIGLNMIKEGIRNKTENIDDKVDFKTMIILAIATSIDALAVGVSFALLKVKIFVPSIIIGIITFIMSIIGVKVGNVFEDKLKDKAEILGGIILILIGIKIVIEHYI